MIWLKIVLRRIMTVLLKGRDDVVVVVSEDATTAVLEGGANPTRPVAFIVLLAIGKLAEQ